MGWQSTPPDASTPCLTVATRAHAAVAWVSMAVLITVGLTSRSGGVFC
jgi:hypothetical protein